MSSRRPAILLILFLQTIFGLPAAVAQDADTLVFTLKEALDLARQNYPEIRKRQAELLATENDTKGVNASYLPKVGMQAQALFATSNQVRGAYYSVDGLAVPIAGGIKQTGFDGKPSWTSLGALTIDWKAFTFGRKEIDRQLSGSRNAYAQQALDQEIFEHQIKVIDAYLVALNSQKLAESQKRNVERTRNILVVTRANAASGLKAGIDSSVAAVEATRARIQWMNSLNVAEMQQVALAELIGRAGEIVRIDTMRFYQNLPYQPLKDTLGLSHHPVLKPWETQLQLSAQTARSIRLNTMPTFSLMGSLWGRGSGISELPQGDQSFNVNSSVGSGLPFRAYNYLMGATITWYPSRYLENKHRVAAQYNRLSEVKESYQLVTQQLTTAQKNASLQFDMAFKTAQEVPLQVAAAREAFAQSSARYNSGLENIMLLTQVSDLYNKAETDYLVSVNNLWRALLVKAAAQGNLNLFLEQIPN